jgi:hypothetical protein
MDFAEAREPSACRVRGWLEGAPIGETRLLLARADVSDFLSLPRDFPVAFRFLTRAVQPNEASREATIEVTSSWDGDAAEYSIGKVSVRLVSSGLEKRCFGKVVSRCKAWCCTAKIFMALARQCWNPAPRYCALSSIISRLEARSSMSDAGPALTLLGWLRPGINGLGWNSIRTACNCRKSAAYRFAESHRARKHSHAGIRNLMKSSAL